MPYILLATKRTPWLASSLPTQCSDQTGSGGFPPFLPYFLPSSPPSFLLALPLAEAPCIGRVEAVIERLDLLLPLRLAEFCGVALLEKLRGQLDQPLEWVSGTGRIKVRNRSFTRFPIKTTNE